MKREELDNMTREEIDAVLLEKTDGMYDTKTVIETLEDFHSIFASVLTDTVNKKNVLTAYDNLSYILLHLHRW